MMNINKILDEIIFRYQIDRYFPHYRKMKEAEEVLDALILDVVEQKKNVIFVGKDQNEIALLKYLIRERNISVFLFKDDASCLENAKELSWKNYDDVYLFSFSGMEHIEGWLQQQGVRFHWIYNIFLDKGIKFEWEFFCLGKEDLFYKVAPEGKHAYQGRSESIQCELLVQYGKYESANNEKDKAKELEKCLFLAIYMKNFVLVEKYVKILQNYDNKFEKFWEELDRLLNTIKELINGRNKEDIIFYWIDGLRYGEQQCMPYLQRVIGEAVEFENAFTYITYTRPTLRSIFLGKKDIDDEVFDIVNITSENSPVINCLEKCGYDIKVYSGMISENFPLKNRGGQFYVDWYLPFSTLMWDVISDMLQQEKKTFWLIHAFETHFPYLSSKMNGENYKAKSERHRLARIELDEQLAFYDAIQSNSTYRIFMSDHGGGEVIHNRFHVLLNIRHNSLRPAKVNNLISLLDFGTILEQLLRNRKLDVTKISREYVEIGAMDRYNYQDMELLFRKKQALTIEGFGFKGIIDEEYIYIRYKTGKEWLAKRNSMPINNPLLSYDCKNDICEPELLDKYRALTGEYPEAINRAEKMIYANYRYILYDKLMEHNDVPKRIYIINQILTKYPPRSVAMRIGGIHSTMLYYILNDENREKIWGIIDIDPGCACSNLNLPVISPDKVSESKEIKAVILSSYANLQILREEAKNWEPFIDILDIYDSFREHGLVCEGNFWGLKGNEEDYDVGFPFKE